MLRHPGVPISRLASGPNSRAQGYVFRVLPRKYEQAVSSGLLLLSSSLLRLNMLCIRSSAETQNSMPHAGGRISSSATSGPLAGASKASRRQTCSFQTLGRI